MRLVFLSIAVGLVFSVLGQTKSRLSTKQLKVGEPGLLIYEFTYPKDTAKVNYYPKKDFIPCNAQTAQGTVNQSNEAELELLEAFRDSLLQNKGTYTWRGIYRFTAWDTGYFVIPPTFLVFKDSVYHLDPQLIEVVGSDEALTSSDKDVAESFAPVNFDEAKWYENWLYWLIAGLVLLVVVILYVRKRRQAQLAQEVRELNLKEKTILGLEALEKAELWKNSEMKVHYSELSFLLRSYLSSRYELNLLEQTSHQTTLLLLKKGLEADTVRTIRELLDYADMAKFADAISSEIEIYKNLKQVKQIIVETSPIEITHVN